MIPVGTVIFVDGWNFKRNLQEFAFISDKEQRAFRLDEKHFHWSEFFKDMIVKVSNSTGIRHHLLRTYWHYAESITPFFVNDQMIEKALSDYQGIFPDLTKDTLITLAEEWHERERSNLVAARERVYEQIQRDVDFLEFRFVGQYKVNPCKIYQLSKGKDGKFFYQGTRETEKGVDIGIAVEMISRMKGYDAAVLVSGDADFVPVVRYLKGEMKWVYQFSVAKGIPPRITYLSPWLKSYVDAFFSFDEEELLGTYLDRHSGIPPAILNAIDERLGALREMKSSTATN